MSKRFKTTGTAAFKLHVFFHPSGTATFYSRDWINRACRPERGLIGLIKYIKVNQAQIKYAMIYDKRGGRDVVIGKYEGKSKNWILKPSIH